MLPKRNLANKSYVLSIFIKSLAIPTKPGCPWIANKWSSLTLFGCIEAKGINVALPPLFDLRKLTAFTAVSDLSTTMCCNALFKTASIANA
ncbi:Uncharacterised protein [Mycoplasmopsis maculosa]|uniref:Uncharacterized protein n=1 Tax=Mycoplasmopsis maculosa TaxID=114885 RepID=A0A449B5F6_9BACT|nr:Uncharacterised protein [Mycoplasmopsis maculosa]